jgi:hypothetical protein
MIKEIAELINSHYSQIRNNNDYYIKLEIGKYHSSEIFEQTTILEGLTQYLQEKYKLLEQKEYYQYQYQNNIYQRERNYKSLSVTDDLIETVSSRDKTKEHGNDFRISLHYAKKQTTFPQQMNYHNIIFVNQEVWQITDNCQLFIMNKNKKKLNLSENYSEIYFKIKIPISEISLNDIETQISNLEQYFKHKYDKKYMFHSLGLVVESEQPHQDEDLDNEP